MPAIASAPAAHPPKAQAIAPAIAQAQAHFIAGRIAAALQLAQQVLAANAEQPDALLIAGLVAQQTREPEKGLQLLARAAALAPSRADILANYGNALRAAERPSEGQTVLERATQLEPSNALIHINHGLVLQDLREFDRAESAFRQAVALDPNMAAAHQSLAHLLMRTDKPQARQHLIRALQLRPAMQEAFKDLCAVLISTGEPGPALQLCQGRTRATPHDQDALAIAALALRDLGRVEEAQQLVGFDVWLKPYPQRAPNGYATMDDFNAALEDHVRQHPKLTSVVYGQATINGQRVNDLLAEPQGPVRLLEQMAIEQMHAFWAQMPKSLDSVFPTQVMPAKTRLRAWAVLMQCNGYETPHLHPDGVVSGVYYVCLPSVVAQQNAQTKAPHEGWIEFGQPDPVYVCQTPPPVRQVQPVPGLMLLFPSYMWHRTIPFDSAQERLSIAFDLTAA